MAKESNKHLHVSSSKRFRETTVTKYVPIIGDILGYWRKEYVDKLGEDIYLSIKTPLEKYDAIYVNGREVEMKYKD